MSRLLIVLALLALFALARPAYASWRRRLAHDDRPVPRLPAGMIAGAERTWVVFTTPYCATCGPVAERLRSSDPGANVVMLDATEHTTLADTYRVRSAPTVLLADAKGDVRARLVGALAVDGYMRAAASA